jgi:hypothetical protein
VSDEQREATKDFIPFLVSGIASVVMGAVIVATLFMGTGTQGRDHASATSLPHAQHHVFSLR